MESPQCHKIYTGVFTDFMKIVLGLREKGLSVKEISEDIKVASKATVSRFLKNNGVWIMLR